MIQLPRTSATRFLSSVGRHELAVLIALVGFAAGAWAFGTIADEVMEGDTQTFDRAVLLAMRRADNLAPIGPLALQEAARDITGLGGLAALSFLTLAVSSFLLLDGKRRMALFVLCSVASGLFMTASLKDAFNRPRPDLVPHATSVSATSFPSGHSMMSAVTYLTLGALLARSQRRKRLKAFLMLLAASLTFMIGLSRVYLGVHWPTDVFAGWTAGASWALLCWFVARLLQSRRALEADADLEAGSNQEA
jgi:undecaprenyl-diphosphatase